LIRLFDNHTLRVNSLINGTQFIAHVTRTRLYQDALLQTAEDLQAAAHFSNTIEFIVDKYGPLSERTTSELCALTNGVGLMNMKTPRSPFTQMDRHPRLLKNHLLLLADKGDELAIQGLEKIKELDNPGDDLLGTTDDTYPDSYDYGAPRVIHI
jgi:hypothetical protein